MLGPREAAGWILLITGLAGMAAVVVWGEIRSRRVKLCFDVAYNDCRQELQLKAKSKAEHRIRIAFSGVREIDAIRISPQLRARVMPKHRPWWRHNDTSGMVKIISVTKASDDLLLPSVLESKPDQRHGQWITFFPPLPVGREGNITLVATFETQGRYRCDLGVRMKTPNGDLYDHRLIKVE